MTPTVENALSTLRTAADGAKAWPEMEFHRVHGPVPERVRFADAVFQDMGFHPGTEIELSSQLQIPSALAGVPLAGDPLELTISSIFPVQVGANGGTVFAEERLPVAPGPALVELLPTLREGDNGEVRVRVQTPQNQMFPWLQLRFTTPGLRRRFESLDIAWARLTLARALAAGTGERELVDRAAALIPDEPLTASHDQLEEILLSVGEILGPFAERAARTIVHLVGHSHIDMNWLWTWPDTREVILRDVRSVVAMMGDYPELTFSHSQPATYEVVRDADPELFGAVVSLIREGRWEPLTMQWVEGDTNMAAGESTVRHLLEAVHYSREVLGARPSVFHAPDTFGHAGNLPQLAAAAGARVYYHHRCNPGGADLWPAYWWEGDDGSRLLAVSTLIYNGDITAGDLASAAVTAMRSGLPCALHFHGIGDHGGGPARHNLDALRRFQDTPGLPRARCSTVTAYAAEVLESGAPLRTHRGESSTVFEGCYTTHADTKRYNRQGENLLVTAETLTALTGRDERATLQRPWRTLLFNQFHDILDGTSIHDVYDKNAQDFEELTVAAAAATNAALSALHGGLQAGAVAVTNPLGFDREDVVTVAIPDVSAPVWLRSDHGHRTLGQPVVGGDVCFVARVPGLSTACYAVDGPADDSSDELRVSERAALIDVETPTFSVRVHRDSGVIVSFIDRRVGRQLVPYGTRRPSDYTEWLRLDLGLNVLQLVDEHMHLMSSWYIDGVHRESHLIHGATTTVAETGPVRVVLETSRAVRSSTIRQRLCFYRDIPRVDVTTEVDWNDAASNEAGIPNLKVAFTCRLDQVEAWYETPFAAAQRPSDGQEYPALRWADVGGDDYGFAVLNDSKYGYDAMGGRLRLSLLRCAHDPDPITDLGHHEVRYSFLPHPGSWRDAGVVAAAAGFNQPLIARTVSVADAAAEPAKPVMRPRVSADNVVMATLKVARDGSGTVIRLYESTGRSAEAVVTGLPAGATVVETTPVEDVLGPVAVDQGRLRLAFQPWQVRTILVRA